MSAPFEFFEHTADIGVRITGSTIEELFRNAAAACYAALGDLAVTNEPHQRRLELVTASPEDLLHDWLTELLYDFEIKRAVYHGLEFQKLSTTQLVAQLAGKRVDMAKSQFNEEIKAVTYHELRVTKRADATWEAAIIFDV